MDFRKLHKLKTPEKIQDFLNKLPFNFEEKGETYMSPKRALEAGKVHCFEGALIAALALEMHGHKPLLLDLKTTKGKDIDHVVALFREKKDPPAGGWGAISKTNHAVLRYREPIYKTIRELALSYFHEYFLNNGEKTLRSFSKPFDLSKVKMDPTKDGASWRNSDKNLFKLVEILDKSPHTQILSKTQIKNLRRADKIEIKAGEIVDHRSKRDPAKGGGYKK
jgi:hypothetical protein